MSSKRYDLEQQEQIARMSIEGGKSGNQIAVNLMCQVQNIRTY